MKRFLSAMLTLIMIISCLSIAACAQATSEVPVVEVGGASILATNRKHRCAGPSQEITTQILEEGLGKYYVSGNFRFLEQPDKPIEVTLQARIEVNSSPSWISSSKTIVEDTQWHTVSGTININKENINKVLLFAQILYSGMTGDAGAYLGDMEWDAFVVCRVYSDGTYGENILVNPDCNIDADGNTFGWEKIQSLTMTNTLQFPSYDETALKVTERASITAGPSQNLTGRLEKGTYLYSGYVRLPEQPESNKYIALGLILSKKSVDFAFPQTPIYVSDTQWHQIKGTITINDDFEYARTFVNVNSSIDFMIDGLFLAKQNADGTYSENIILNSTMEHDENGLTPEWGKNGVATITNTGFTNESEQPEQPEDTRFSGVENADGTISYEKGYVPVTDKNILYSGRWYDVAEGTKQVAFEGYVEIKFTGTSIQVLTPASGSAYAEIDGILSHTLHSLGSGPVIVNNLSEGEHTLKLFAQAQASRFSISGFKIDENAKTMPLIETKRIEFIGASMAEGYVDPADRLSDLSYNSYLNSFTSKTGRMLNKEYGWSFNTVAFGGNGVVASKTDTLSMPERYFRDREYIASTDGTTKESALAATSEYDTTKYVPDYIVFNLGTNDGGADNIAFVNNYIQFIKDLKKVYPDVVIFCMTPFNGTKEAQVKLAVSTFSAEDKVYVIDCVPWNIPGGADGLHPTPANHDIIAEKLFADIKNYVDNGTIPEVESLTNAKQFNVTEDIYHAYPYFRTNSINATGLTADMADENGYIERSYNVYNVGNCDLQIRVYWQSGWSELKDSGSRKTLTVKKGEKQVFVIKVKIDENGMTTKADGSKVDLSTLTFRTEVPHDPKSENIIPAGASYIIAPEDAKDLSVVNIDYLSVYKGTDGRGSVSCNAVKELPEEKIMGATVDIGATLTVNYFAQLWDNLDATLKVTRNGATVELTGTYDSATGYYIYQYKGINPQCMTDNISAELIAGGKVIDSKAEYSVKEYANNLASKTAAQLNLTDEKYNELITLLSDMLVYGKVSQDYMKYNLNDLATTDVAWLKASEFTTPENVVKNIIINDANNKVAGAGVRIENVNRIYFTVNLTVDAEVYVDGEKAEVIDNKVYTKDIKATGFGDIHTAEIKVNGETVSKVEYNVNAYINAKNADAKIGTLVKALGNYGVSAVAYGK